MARTTTQKKTKKKTAKKAPALSPAKLKRTAKIFASTHAQVLDLAPNAGFDVTVQAMADVFQAQPEAKRLRAVAAVSRPALVADSAALAAG